MMKLTVEKRDKSTPLEAIRAAELIPGVSYGKVEESVPVSFSKRDFLALYAEAGEATIIGVEGLGEEKDVLIKDVQRHPVSGDILHVDLYSITRGEEMELVVPIEFVGQSPVEKAGGVVLKVARELLIKSLPRNIPSEIIVDLSVVAEVGDSLHVRDIQMPEGVTAVTDMDEALVTSSEAQEIVEEEVPTTIDMDAIESEQKGKGEDADAPAESEAGGDE